MLSPLATDGLVDLPSLQAELQALGITVVSSRQDTVFAVKIKGLAGQALTRGLQLADHVLHAKILHALQLHTAPATHRFTDPTFGPCRNDCDGIAAMCQANGALKSKGESQHRAKVRGLLERGKLRWERPVYASEHRVESRYEACMPSMEQINRLLAVERKRTTSALPRRRCLLPTRRSLRMARRLAT